MVGGSGGKWEKVQNVYFFLKKGVLYLNFNKYI